MEEKNAVPYIVHEAAQARQERTIRRLWILCIIMFLSLVISNAGWIWYESQFEEVVETTTQEVEQDADGDGSNIFVGGDYGKTEGEDYQDEENP